MRTDLPAEFLATDRGRRANEILRSCVHCGFCNATCPTYQLTGDELDGPRGRIYLIRDLLEGEPTEQRAQMHLDRCLTCRACETTCPSGVEYGELAEIARIEIGPGRRGLSGVLRKFVRWLVPDANRLRLMSRFGKMVKPIIPARLRHHVPVRIGRGTEENLQHERRVLLLEGCAQQVTTGATNDHLRSFLDRHDVGVVLAPDEGCCGALDLHLGDEDTALDRIRKNVDALSPHLDECEAIVSSASGCGVTVKDYGRLLAHDPDYAELAARVSAATLDVVEYVTGGGFQYVRRDDVKRVAWHAPCTLQHGMKISGQVEQVLEQAGYELVPVQDSHLCCGSAGTYSILQSQMADVLGERKVTNLLAHHPDVVATANVGCQSHLVHRTTTPIVHWIELLE